MIQMITLSYLSPIYLNNLQITKVWWVIWFVSNCSNSFDQIFWLIHGHIPVCHESQAIKDCVITRVSQTHFWSLNCNGRLGRDDFCKLNCCRLSCFCISKCLRKETHLFSLSCRKFLCGEYHFLKQRVITNRFWNSLEWSKIRCDANFWLSHVENSVCSRITNVACSQEWKSCSNTATMDSCDNWFSTSFNGWEVILEFGDKSIQEFSFSSNVICLKQEIGWSVCRCGNLFNQFH